jgi:hypothetical protein
MPFINTLYNLWPNGDEKVTGLRDGIANSAQAVFAKYGINSRLLVAHVMAQISHECGAGHDVVENLNYSASRMTEVWPSRFRTVASAARLLITRKPSRTRSTTAAWATVPIGRRLEFPRQGRFADHGPGRLRAGQETDRARCRQQSRHPDRPEILPRMRGFGFHQLRLSALRQSR